MSAFGSHQRPSASGRLYIFSIFHGSSLPFQDPIHDPFRLPEAASLDENPGPGWKPRKSLGIVSQRFEIRKSPSAGTEPQGQCLGVISVHPDTRNAKAPQEFTGGTFREILGDTGAADPSRVARVVFCSGKIYYDLTAARDERKADHVALVRVEQLYPFAADQAADVLLRYPVTAETVWAQEEPRNMGPWRFMREQIQPLLDATRRELRYVGRPEMASPAGGSGKRHQQEQAEILNDALTPGAVSASKRMRLVPGRKK